MRHSVDLGDVSCSLYLLVESVRVPDSHFSHSALSTLLFSSDPISCHRKTSITNTSASKDIYC